MEDDRLEMESKSRNWEIGKQKSVTRGQKSEDGGWRSEFLLSPFLILIMQRIVPFQPGEAREVCVRGLQDQSPFNRQRRQMRIGRQIARCADFFDQIRQQHEMLPGWMNDFDVRLLHPGFHYLQYVGRRTGILINPVIGQQTDETQQCHPRQSNHLRTIQLIFPPVFGLGMVF